AADTGLLEAPERHLRVDDHAVHRDAAGTHASRHLVAALRIRSVDGAVQTVDRIVRLAHGIVEIIELDERHHGAENLFPGDRHRAVDVRENRRLDEVPALEPLGPPASDDEARALLPALL